MWIGTLCLPLYSSLTFVQPCSSGSVNNVTGVASCTTCQLPRVANAAQTHCVCGVGQTDVNGTCVAECAVGQLRITETICVVSSTVRVGVYSLLVLLVVISGLHPHKHEC